MAITVPITPLVKSRLSDSLQFSFNMSDVGDGTSTKKYIAYRVRKSGVAVTDWIDYEPKANVMFPISIGPTCKRELKTAIPDIGATGFAINGVEQVEMMGVFDIEYKEISKNLGTCEDVVEGALADTTDITVINSTENFYEEELLTESRVLTSRPCLTGMWSEGEDWLYLYAVGFQTVQFNAYNKAGVQLGFHSVNCSGGTGKVFRVQCGPLAMRSLIGGAAYYTYSVLGKTYKVIIEDYDEDFKCVFQEKQGGYAGMTFKLGDRSGSMTDIRTKRYTAPSNAGSLNKRHKAGVSIIRKTSNRVLTISKNIEAYIDIDEWLNEFIESESYIITYKGKTVKAAIVAGSYNYGNDENHRTFSCQIEILPEQKRPSNFS